MRTTMETRFEIMVMPEGDFMVASMTNPSPGNGGPDTLKLASVVAGAFACDEVRERFAKLVNAVLTFGLQEANPEAEIGEGTHVMTKIDSH